MAGITSINLNKNQSLTALKASDFAGLTSLTDLYLAANNLSSLPTGVFDNLTSLISLYLGQNNLSSLPTGVFDSLTNLGDLDLSDNNLSSLPTGVFDNLTNLRALRLRNNSLSSLPAGVFDNLTRLTALYLYTNSLSSLPTGVFDNLTNLRDLDLSDNNLSSLQTGVFDNLTSLEGLNLWSNSLSNLPTGVFDNLTNLRNLNLSDNNLSSLQTRVFDNLTSLTEMRLRNNSLSSLPAGVFDNLTSLEVLSLYNNSLTSLETGVFDDLTSLEWLSLRLNDLTCLPSIPSSVIYLYLDRPRSAYPPCAPGVTITQPNGSTSVTEKAGEDRNDTYTVVLDSEPTGNVTITVESGDSGAATVSPATLTFTTTNWRIAQTVTVTGVDDDVDQSGDRSVTISHIATSSDPQYNGISIASVTATVSDDDVRGVTVSASSSGLSIREADDSSTGDAAEHVGNYTVVLDSEPTGNVTITVESGTPSAATVSPATLTFTTTNWSSSQTVTVTGVDDDLDNPGNQRQVTISHGVSASGTDYEDETAASVVVTVGDDDGTGVTIKESDGSTSVTEKAGDGRDDTYTVVLDSEPIANVTITVTSGTVGAATVSPATLTFTTTNWGTAQTVTVTGVDDDVDQSSDRSVTISHGATSSDADYNGISISDVTAVVMDDDVRGVTVSASSSGLSIREADDSSTGDAAEHVGNYTVVLDSEPTGNVTITVESGTPSAATVSPATLTFTTTNWSSSQTVTVTGVDDDLDNPGNQRQVTISHGVSASGTDYEDETAASVVVTVGDDDGTGVTIKESDGSTSVTEKAGDGRNDTYTVVLDSEPTGTVTVVARVPQEAPFTAAPSSLTFTTTTWNSAQTVTVTGVDDDVNNPGDQRQATISHNVSASGTNYEHETAASVVVTVIDDDGTGVTIKESDGSTSVTEKAGDGRDDTYTVVLDSEPIANVTITVTSGTVGAATVSPATLTFTSDNWNMAQTVTVTGVDDQVDQSSDRSVTISHRATSSDTTYDQINIANVTATVMDNDMVGVTITESDGFTSVTEASGKGHTDTYT